MDAIQAQLPPPANPNTAGARRHLAVAGGGERRAVAAVADGRRIELPLQRLEVGQLRHGRPVLVHLQRGWPQVTGHTRWGDGGIGGPEGPAAKAKNTSAKPEEDQYTAHNAHTASGGL